MGSGNALAIQKNIKLAEKRCVAFFSFFAKKRCVAFFSFFACYDSLSVELCWQQK